MNGWQAGWHQRNGCHQRNGWHRGLVRLAMACGCLAAACDRGAGQAIEVVGGFRAGWGGGRVGGARNGLDGAWNGLDVVVEGDTIGDPWWDEVEEKSPAAANRAPAGDEAGVQSDLVTQHLRKTGLTALRRELSVVRQTCPSLEQQQRALVLAAGRGAIDSFVAEIARDNKIAKDNPVRGRPGKPGDVKPGDVAAAVEAAVRTSVSANATPDESAAYEAEQPLRRERAKQAAASVIVAAIDRDAHLDESERKSLVESLAASYRERWSWALVAMQQGRGVEASTRLQGVERCVEQALGKERTAAWRKQREESQTLANAGRLPQPIVPMQMVPNGPVNVQVKALGVGNQQQVIINGKQVFVGGAGGGLEVRVEAAGGGVEIQPVPGNAAGGGEPKEEP